MINMSDTIEDILDKLDSKLLISKHNPSVQIMQEQLIAATTLAVSPLKSDDLSFKFSELSISKKSGTSINNK